MPHQRAEAYNSYVPSFIMLRLLEILHHDCVHYSYQANYQNINIKGLIKYWIYHHVYCPTCTHVYQIVLTKQMLTCLLNYYNKLICSL